MVPLETKFVHPKSFKMKTLGLVLNWRLSSGDSGGLLVKGLANGKLIRAIQNSNTTVGTRIITIE